MVVDEAGGLHERIDDHRTAEPESATFQGLGHGFRCGGLGWSLADRGPAPHRSVGMRRRPTAVIAMAIATGCAAATGMIPLTASELAGAVGVATTTTTTTTTTVMVTVTATPRHAIRP